MGKGNDFWLDDPEWEALRRKADGHSAPKKLKYKSRATQQKPQQQQFRREPAVPPRAQARREDTDKEVVVNLKLAIPKVKLPNLKKLFQAHRKRFIHAGALVVVVVIIFGAFKLWTGRTGKDGGETKTPLSQAQTEFKPLLPLEGFQDASGRKVAKPQVKFDPEKNVLGYVTEYNEAQLTVSQQQLPEQLKIHPGQLEGIARSVNANIPIETHKGKAYIATDDKTKSQIAVFATKDALVFIRSTKTLDTDEWKVYINQLNPTDK